jgi:hypothetical protein
MQKIDWNKIFWILARSNRGLIIFGVLAILAIFIYLDVRNIFFNILRLAGFRF